MTQAFTNTTNFPAMASTNQTLAGQLLYFLSGSSMLPRQVYFLQDSKDISKWENYLTVERKLIDVRQIRLAAFFKDDWKMTRGSTWNLDCATNTTECRFEIKDWELRPSMAELHCSAFPARASTSGCVPATVEVEAC